MAVAMLLSFAGAAKAQPLSEVVPDDALIYIAWRGAKNLGPGYEGSHLKAVLESSNIPALFEEFLPKALAKLGQDGPRDFQGMEVLTPMLKAAWKYPTAFYFGGVDFPANEEPAPRVGLYCQAGADAPALANDLNKLLDESGAPFRANAKDGLVSMTHGQLPKGAIGQSDRFKKAMAHAGKDPVVVAYVDAEGLMKTIDIGIKQGGSQREQQEWAKARVALGLDGIKSAVLTAGFEGKDWSTRLFIEAPGAVGMRRGLLAMLDNKPVSDALLKLVPKNAAWAMAFRFDADKFLDDVMQIVTVFEPRAAQDLEEGLAEIKENLGFDLRKDFLAALGDEWAVYADNQLAGNGLLGLTVVNRLRDAKKFNDSVLKVQAFATAMFKQELGGERGPQINMRSVKAGGNTIHYLAVPAVAPAWTIQGDTWIAGLYPQVVIAAADQIKAGGPSILENPGFKDLHGRLNKAAPSNFIAYADLPQTAVEGYQTTLMLSQLLLGMGDLFGVESPALVIPTLPKLRPHLSPAGAASWMDKDGWHFVSQTPFPGAEILAGQGNMMISQQAMLLGMMMPMYGAARAEAFEGRAVPQPQVIEEEKK